MRSPVTYNQDEQLAQVVTKFIKNKSDFDLDRDEKKNLYNLLMTELYQLSELHNLQVIDINCFIQYETTYYTFTFESLVTLNTTELKNQAADAALKFMQRFTDNDGIFISFTKMDPNNWIYQLNFRIS
nr:MAG: hypothetical protein [Bacteriophage sp.]